MKGVILRQAGSIPHAMALLSSCCPTSAAAGSPSTASCRAGPQALDFNSLVCVGRVEDSVFLIEMNKSLSFQSQMCFQV